MKSNSRYEKIREELEDSDNTYCGFCLVLNDGSGCDCGNHAWRYFHQLDEATQREIISEAFDLTEEKQ